MPYLREPSISLEPLRRQVAVQGSNGNWNYDVYMMGMYNGLECALATLEKREPRYKTKPRVWLKDLTATTPFPTPTSPARGGEGLR